MSIPNELEIKEIKIKDLSGNNIKLDAKVNINDTVLDLYYIIQSETGKVNIISMIINNDYLLNVKNGRYISVDILSINNKPQIIDDIDTCKVSTLLNEDYNKDYTGPEGPCRASPVEVLLIFGSYIPYIKSIFIKYANKIRINNFHIDLRYLYNYNCEDQTRKENKTEFLNKLNEIIINFKEGMSKLNNDCIPSDDYDEIESYILKDTIEFKHKLVVLHEIKKYLAINCLDLTLSNNI